ncbi:MAG: hypothetical protein L0099_13595 [Acidobacteria bacterium]|nr:hypothetical protein [Acidobacteriota bacterium]
MTVTGLAVEPMHDAVPKVSSGALLTVAFTGSETDHVTLVKLELVEVVVEQPLIENATAANCFEFPGGGAVELAVAF